MHREHRPAGERWPRLGDRAAAALVGIASAAALLAAAAQVAGFEFVIWDDNRIVDSLVARDTAWPSRLAWMLDPFTTRMYTPVGTAAWGLLADAFGVAPAPFHLAALLAHAVSVVLLALVCRAVLALTRAPADPGAPPWAWTAAVSAAALWGVHPLRAEVIGWMSALAYPLSTALGLAALLAFLGAGRGGRRGERASLAAAAVLYVLACLTHPQVTALCVVFVLVDLSLRPGALRRGSPPRWAVGRVGWHGAMLAVAAGVSILGAVLRTGDRPPLSAAYLGQQGTKLLGFAGEFTLLHGWVPLHTSLVYPEYGAGAWRSPPFLLGVAALGALVAWGWRRARRGAPGLRVAVLAHLAFAVPASGLFLEVYNRGDRYTGALTALAAVVAAHVVRDVLAAGGPRAAVATLAAVLLVVGAEGRVLAAGLARWRDTESLMEHLVATAPELRWKLFAGVRIVMHWERRNDAARTRAALSRLMDLPDGPEQERVVRTTRYLMRTGHCPEAAILLDVRGGALGGAERESLADEVRRCAPGS